jgi:N-acetylneuraminic acid mutarotase
MLPRPDRSKRVVLFGAVVICMAGCNSVLGNDDGFWAVDVASGPGPAGGQGGAAGSGGVADTGASGAGGLDASGDSGGVGGNDASAGGTGGNAGADSSAGGTGGADASDSGTGGDAGADSAMDGTGGYSGQPAEAGVDVGAPDSVVDARDATPEGDAGAAQFAWATKQPMTVALSDGASAVVGNVLLAINGSEGAPGSCRIVEAYDPTANRWTTKATYPRSEGRFGQGAASVGTSVYVFGGINCWGNYATTTVDRYETAGDTWTMGVGTYPLTVSGSMCAGVGTDVYCFGGWEYNGAQHKESYRFSATAGTFTPIADMPTARSYGQVIALGGLVYVIGGETAHAPQTLSDRVETYDVSAGTWNTVAPLPAASEAFVAGAVAGRIYVAGGYSQGAISDGVYQYDPAQNHWRVMAPLTEHRYGAYGGGIGDKFYLVGGRLGSGYTKSTGTMEGTLVVP